MQIGNTSGFGGHSAGGNPPMLMWFLFKRTLLAAAGMRSEHCGLSRHAAAIGAFREDSPSAQGPRRHCRSRLRFPLSASRKQYGKFFTVRKQAQASGLVQAKAENAQ